MHTVKMSRDFVDPRWLDNAVDVEANLLEGLLRKRVSNLRKHHSNEEIKQILHHLFDRLYKQFTKHYQP